MENKEFNLKINYTNFIRFKEFIELNDNNS